MATVIIGMDGKIESLVAAYLLKKQGHKCIGVTVSLRSRNEFENEIFEEWLPSDLDLIKSYCDQLEIPYYATEGYGEFLDQVIDPLVAARLQGRRYDARLDYNKLIVSKLMEKKGALKADFVATGHFAKLYKNQITGEHHLLSSNDLNNDESFGVATLPDSYYDHLLFPLSDLRREETQRIYDLVGINVDRDYKELKRARRDFDIKDKILDLIKERAPHTMIKEGVVYSQYDGRTLGDHESHSDFYIGQTRLNFKMSQPLDKNMVVVRVVPSNGSILLGREDKLKHSHLYISHFICEEALDRSMPINCYYKISNSKEIESCCLYFKNNDFALVDLKGEKEGVLSPGIRVAFYNRKGVGAKVIGSGVVKSYGYYENAEYRQLPFTKEEEDVLKKPLIDIFQMRL